MNRVFPNGYHPPARSYPLIGQLPSPGPISIPTTRPFGSRFEPGGRTSRTSPSVRTRCRSVCSIFRVPNPKGASDLVDIGGLTIRPDTPLQVTGVVPGWVEVLVTVPPVRLGDLPQAVRGWIRTRELVDPPAGSEEPSPPGGGSTTPGGGAATPAGTGEPSRTGTERPWTENVGEVVVLTSPLWGAVLFNALFPR